jgi:hypothetical protein
MLFSVSRNRINLNSNLEKSNLIFSEQDLHISSYFINVIHKCEVQNDIDRAAAIELDIVITKLTIPTPLTRLPNLINPAFLYFAKQQTIEESLHHKTSIQSVGFSEPSVR